ncbi:hypothetical protein ACWDG1_14240 [Streptomyces sp. NPDC001177]
MPRRSRLLTTAAASATAALLLAGCGGDEDDGSKASDKPAGADSRGSASPAPAPSTPTTASAATAAGRPKITLPLDVTDKYEHWKTGDATKDAILTDIEARIDATNDAILRGDTNAPALSFYYRDQALKGAVAWVQAYLDANLSFTGTTRYYTPKITLSGGTNASVIYCSDESKGFNKNRETGKVDKSPSKQSPYVGYSTRLQKNENGVWQTTDLSSKRGNKTCGA